VRDRLFDALLARPLVLDAAMGTRLIDRGLDLRSEDPALWNLSNPDSIGSIHRADIAAGADAVVTNTFGANRVWLARYGREADVTAINRQAVAIARDAAGPDRFLLGSIGPTAARSKPTRWQKRSSDFRKSEPEARRSSPASSAGTRSTSFPA
jgi:methionine synthase I (cobalamin-dependent)